MSYFENAKKDAAPQARQRAVPPSSFTRQCRLRRNASSTYDSARPSPNGDTTHQGDVPHVITKVTTNSLDMSDFVPAQHQLNIDV